VWCCICERIEALQVRRVFPADEAKSLAQPSDDLDRLTDRAQIWNGTERLNLRHGMHAALASREAGDERGNTLQILNFGRG
jgi:hypothetical protein